jgi:hypothetical protein
MRATLSIRIASLLLAALLPLGQAHCLWMSGARAATCERSTAAAHSCCAPAATRPAPPPAAGGESCPCFELPEATTPSTSTVPRPEAATLAVAADEPVPPGPAPALAPWTPPDTGPPPSRAASGAHGLRAPPYRFLALPTSAGS